MENKRDQSKQRTRSLILLKSKGVFTRQGILATTTAELARACGVAHGSLFQHFGSRENLIAEVLDGEIKRIAGELEESLHPGSGVEALIEKYLDLLEQEEAFFSMLYKELPYFSGVLKRQVISLETIVRNAFYLELEKGIAEGRYRQVNITAGLNAFFGTVYYYLCLRDLYTVGDEPVITRKRGEVRDVFLKLILNG